MSWMEVLAKTYDNCIGEVGINRGTNKNPILLLPLSHLTVNAIAEIILNENGDFLGANKVDKNDQITIVPVTEDSASRSSGISPFPMADKLSYIAADYDDVSKDEKSYKAHYKAYIENLHKWADLPDTPVKVKAICVYLDKGAVMRDLISVGVYDGKDGFVRFIVNGNSTEPEETRTWLDKEIWDNFINYYNTTFEDCDIDYVTGERCMTTDKLPAKIRSTADGAKLISSNDTSGYTYRGRFVDAKSAASIGYETSQKAHNALRWLIAKQGYRNDSECIVCWSIGGEEMPPIISSTDDMIDSWRDDKDEALSDTDESFAKQLNKYIAGYKQEIGVNTRAIVMAVDTADGSIKGRLAITYYQELEGSRLLENLHKWHRECSWKHYVKKGDKGHYYVGAPSPREIVLCAYGTQQGAFVSADGKMIKRNIDRILPCIVQGKRFPKDIMRAAVRNAGNPQRFSRYNWNNILTWTCAVIIKCQYDYGKEVFKMALNKESTDRDYLFGRLLAVAHKLEDYVNFKSGNSERETNAMKYWSAYAQKPARTYETIRRGLQSYISRLSKGSRDYYQQLTEEIFDKLAKTDSFNNEPLNENYLLGYYSQMAEFRKNNKNNNMEEQ